MPEPVGALPHSRSRGAVGSRIAVGKGHPAVQDQEPSEAEA